MAEKVTLDSIVIGGTEYDVGGTPNAPHVLDDNSDADLNIGDSQGNVLAEFKGGHVRTKNFDSRNAGTVIKKQVGVIYPKTVYTVCNDIGIEGICQTDPYEEHLDPVYNARQYSQKIRIDSFFHKLTEPTDLSVDGNGEHELIFESILSTPAIKGYGFVVNKIANFNSHFQSQDVNIVDVPITLKGVTYEDKTFNIKHVSTRNTITANKPVRLLCIGDSVTFGSFGSVNKPYPTAPNVYWEWVKALFEMDKSQNANVGFNCLILGNSLDGGPYKNSYFDIFDVKIDGYDIQGIKASACGMGGSTTRTWFGPTLVSPDKNPFYDVSKGTFSLRYWVENYRTLMVNQDGTTRACTDSEYGALAVGGYRNCEVCEPTHVLIQLGYNQAYSSASDSKRTQYLSDIRSMIDIIHEEYPGIHILLSLPDCAGTYYPDDFHGFSSVKGYDYPLKMWEGTCKSWHDKFAYMNTDLMSLEDTDNRVWYVPTYFASLGCRQAATKRSNQLDYYVDGSDDAKHNSATAWIPYQHPNNAGHASWAYQIYSLIKYTLTL